MRTALLAAAILLTTSSAFAWDAKTGGSGPQAIGQDGGLAQSQQARQHQTQGQAQRQGQSQTARGGNATSTGSTANATAGGANVNISGLGNGGGGSSGGGGRAPDVFLPSIGGGGMDCPTVGFGAAGSGLGGGGGFGPSWISSDCNKRKIADLLANLYGPAVARAYAEQNLEGVSAAVAVATAGSHTDPAPAPHTRDAAFCNRIDTQRRALTGREIADYTEKCR